MTRLDKMNAARAARDLLQRGEGVIFDTETTGLEDARMISIAVIDFTGGVLLDARVDPQRLIDSGATEVHGVQSYEVVGMPVFLEIYDDLCALLHNQDWIVYNVAFDSTVIRNHCQELTTDESLHIKPRKTHCAMQLFAKFYGEWSDYWGNYKWQRLSHACQYFDIEVSAPEHSALGDCLRTLKVLEAMADYADEHEKDNQNEYEKL